MLSLGENFGLPLDPSCKKDRTNVILETIKNFESNQQNLSKETVEMVRSSIADLLRKFLCNNKHIRFNDRFNDRFIQHGHFG